MLRIRTTSRFRRTPSPSAPIRSPDSTRSVLCTGSCEVLFSGPRPHAARRRQCVRGLESGSPFFGSICFPSVPDPEPPGEGTAEVAKTGAFVGGDVVFTVTVSNPTTFVAPDVVVVEYVAPDRLTWTLPPGACSAPATPSRAVPSATSRAVPPSTSCSRQLRQLAFAGSSATTPRRSSDGRSHRRFRSRRVDVPCPPDPEPDPLVLLTKVPSTYQ